MKKSRIYFAIAALITIIIFANSAQSGEVSAEISSGVLSWILKLLSGTGITISHFFIRKSAHITEFFLQAFFLGLGIKNTKFGFKRGAVYVAFTGLFTACCDEFLQLFSDGRGSQVSDVFIDFSGTVAAVLVVGAVYFIGERRRGYAGG